MQFGARRRPSRRKLLVESLENRRVMATFQGDIFLDTNINGTKDVGENLLTGQSITVYVDLNTNGVREATEPFAITNTGSYFISAPLLGAGTYRLNTDSSPLADSKVTNFVFDPLASPTPNVPDMGVYRLGEIRGLAFIDVNADGIKQNVVKESFTAGLKFKLTHSGGEVKKATSAAASPGTPLGELLFTNLKAGTWTLTSDDLNFGQTTVDPKDNPDDPNELKKTFLTFTINTSSQSLTPNVGDFRFGEIYAYTFVDVNGNKTEDAGDNTPATNVTPVLTWAGPDNDFTTAGNNKTITGVVTTVGTRSTFLFPKLEFGRYRVEPLVLPNGVIRTTDPINVITVNDSGLIIAPEDNFVVPGFQQTLAAPVAELKIGVFRFGTISGYAFGDRNGDGVGNAEPRGDAALSVPPEASELRVKVQLRNSATNSIVQGPLDTLPNGQYTFSNLLAGTYSVEVVSLTPLETVDGQRSRAFTTPRTIANLVVTSGSVYQPVADLVAPLDPVYQTSMIQADLAIGSAKQAYVRGMVFLDRNGDGVRGSLEPGMATFTASIVSSGQDNILGNGDDVALPAKLVTTDSTGLFEFNLFPHYVNATTPTTNVTQAGSFRITISLPDHYRRSNSQPTTFDVTNVRLNDIILGTGLAPKVSPVNADQTIKRSASLDIGVERFAAIQGIVFNDLNGNGVKDAGEGGLKGQVVQIANTTIQKTTDKDGVYLFDDLLPGTYTVVPTLNTDTATGQEIQGRTKEYAIVNASLNNTYVAPGQDLRLAFEKADSTAPSVERIGKTEINELAQGIVQLSKIEGVIYIDSNVDGEQQTGEAGQAGVKVALRRVVRNFVQDELPADRLVTTDSAGKYTFFVWPGTYDVAQEKPTGFEPIGSAPTVIAPVPPSQVPPITLQDESRQRFTDFGLINPNSGISTQVKIGKALSTTAAALDIDGIQDDLIVVYEYFNLGDITQGGGVSIFKNVGTDRAKTISIPLGKDSRPSFASAINLNGAGPSEIVVTLSGTPTDTVSTKAWGSVVILVPDAAAENYQVLDAATGAPGGGNTSSDYRAALAGNGPKHISYAKVDDLYYLSIVNERTFNGVSVPTQDVSIVRQAAKNSLTFVKVKALNISTQFVVANVITTAFGNFDGLGQKIAVAESNLGRVEFFTKDGAPTMSPLTALSNPTHVLTGNFVDTPGAIGTEDLVVSEYGASRFSLYPQINGALSVGNRIVTPTLSKPGFMTAVDINGDRLLDLGVASLGDGRPQIFYNRLVGIPAPTSTKFQATNPLTTWDSVNRQASVQQLAFGDFNGVDGSKDMVAAPFTGSLSLHPSAVTSLAKWDEQKTLQKTEDPDYAAFNTNVRLNSDRALASSALPSQNLFPIEFGITKPNVDYNLKKQLTNNGAIKVGPGFRVDTSAFVTSAILKTGNARIAPAALTLSTEIAASAKSFDVSGNGQLEPMDALLVINGLNRQGNGEQMSVDFDVSGDGLLSPLDALLIINQLNNSTAIGQTIDVSSAQSMFYSSLARLGAAPALLSSLVNVNVMVDDLPDGVLSWVDGNNLVVDRNASGRGWFVDPSPTSDSEFATERSVIGVDLLSVITHEIGHLIGLEDLLGGSEDEIMHATLRSGERRLDADSVDRLLGQLI